MIFAVDQNWSIGMEGKMLFHIGQDLQRFKKITMGNIMVMGRKTYHSLRGGDPLPGREHIVLTRNTDYRIDHPNVHIIHSLEELDSMVKKLDPSGKKEVFMIGGGNLAEQVVDQCSYAYITKVLQSVKSWDTCIPNLDQRENWEIAKESEVIETEGKQIIYVDYVNTKFSQD